MKSVQITGHGAPEKLKLTDAPVPEITDDQVLIKVAAAGVNFADILARQGLYPEIPKLPFIPGYEVAGTIEKAGKNAQNLKQGQRVAAFTNYGGYAEYAVSVPRFTAALDPSVAFTDAAAVPVNWLTAHHSIFYTGPVQKGDRALVHAAAGGVGIAAVNLLKNAGYIVYGTAGSDEKLDFLKSIGVDFPINYRTSDFQQVIEKESGLNSLDLIIDSIGGDYVKKGLKLLRANGRLILIGAASFAGLSKIARIWKYMRTFKIGPFHLIGNSHGVYGVSITKLIKQRPDLAEAQFRKIISMLNAGEIKPKIDGAYPFEKAAGAHARIESRKSIGKVVLINE